MTGNSQPPDLMTPSEVAALLRVDPKTVSRWGADGRLWSAKTPGGHRRYSRLQVTAIVRGDETPWSGS